MTIDRIRPQVTGIVLAGGRGNRMGAIDKGLVNYRGKPMIASVLETLEQALDKIVISANRNIDAYRKFGYPVTSDSTREFAGPLAGMQSGLALTTTPYAFIVPCDTPGINTEILLRLFDRLGENASGLAVASINSKIEPVVLLLETNLLQSINSFIARGERKTGLWVQEQSGIPVDFSDHAEWFYNINRPEDMVQSV